jgi:hypothetical protein
MLGLASVGEGLISSEQVGRLEGNGCILVPSALFHSHNGGVCLFFVRLWCSSTMVIERSCLASGSKTLPEVDFAGALHVLLHFSSLDHVPFPDGWPGCSWFCQKYPQLLACPPWPECLFVICCFGCLRALAHWLHLNAMPEFACQVPEAASPGLL